MSDQTPPSAPDDQPTERFAATAGDAVTVPGQDPAATAAHQSAPCPTPAVGPTTTAYPAGQAATAGSVPPRRGVPAWAIAAAVVGGVVLVGGGFAGGLGAGLLLGHRDSAVVERADLRRQMMDRLDERRSGNDRPSWGDSTGP